MQRKPCWTWIHYHGRDMLHNQYYLLYDTYCTLTTSSGGITLICVDDQGIEADGRQTNSSPNGPDQLPKFVISGGLDTSAENRGSTSAVM